MPITTPEFPDHLQVLFRPKRYKVLWGGRGAGRSWGVARALLLIGANRCIRVLCCRELQKSISESVHKVLADQIIALGLSEFYDVEVAKIKGKNGTTFSFEGIKNNTTAIKSYEGIDYCWVEEANKVTKQSWGILTPTIRKESPIDWRERGMEKPDFQAEIWMTFNPELDTDYTYIKFAKSKSLKPVHNIGSNGQPWTYMESDDTISVKMTYKDNPWFPNVLKQDMLKERAEDYDNYLNVWEGCTLQQLEGAVFKHQLRKCREEGRVCAVPWEPEVDVDCFWDLGKRDYTAIWFGQYVGMEFRMLAFFEGSGQPDLNYYIKEVQSRPYTYGTMYLPHDAKHTRLGMKHSIEAQMKAKFGKDRVKIVPRIALKADAINMGRLFFQKCWFDEFECAEGLSHLGRYSFKVESRDSNGVARYSKEPEHDSEGHVDAADAFMGAAQAFSMPKKRGLLSNIGLPESMRRRLENRFGASDVNAASARGRSGSGTGWMGN